MNMQATEISSARGRRSSERGGGRDTSSVHTSFNYYAPSNFRYGKESFTFGARRRVNLECGITGKMPGNPDVLDVHYSFIIRR